MNKPKMCLAILIVAILSAASSQNPGNIFSAILNESGVKTAEVSTAELQKILAESSVVVLDARPHLEFAISHIPGAQNVAPKPGVSPALYVSDAAEIGRLVRQKKDTPLVLYCNGPHCGKSKRLADEMLGAGFTNVRRYQLGIPVWRALGGLTQVEIDGIQHISRNDRTAVFIDARDAAEFAGGTLLSAKNLPSSGVLQQKDTGEVRKAKDDGRLPMEDHNTRIIVFGSSKEQAIKVAEGVAREAFHNVAYFAGTFDELRRAVAR